MQFEWCRFSGFYARHEIIRDTNMPLRGKLHEDDPIALHPPHYLRELPLEEEERFEKLFLKLAQREKKRIAIEDLSSALKEYGLHHRYAEVSF